MPSSLNLGILGASAMIISKDIDKYAFMCGSNFYETDVTFLDYPTFTTQTMTRPSRQTKTQRIGRGLEVGRHQCHCHQEIVSRPQRGHFCRDKEKVRLQYKLFIKSRPEKKVVFDVFSSKSFFCFLTILQKEQVCFCQVIAHYFCNAYCLEAWYYSCFLQ